MRNLTLRQIKIFLSAAKHLSFAKAAEELYVTPAAISLQIKEMESDLGISLFTRNNRKVMLSQAGSYFLPYAIQK
jgi:DNA-binding transcriptional LysR family regulator